ncbi:MAG: hypothetical protein KDD39_15390 [Bdellovibrionales bacterium]|nr:hypothetical protein [Bdellovibrionales bacterium]
MKTLVKIALLLLVSMPQAFAVGCGPDIAKEAGDPPKFTVSAARSHVKKRSSRWTDLAAKLGDAGLLEDEVTLEVPVGLFQIGDIYVGYANPADFQKAVEEITAHYPGLLAMQTYMRWCKWMGDDVGTTHAAALMFLGLFNRPGLEDEAYPFEKLTRMLFTDIPPLRDMMRALHPGVEDTEQALYEVFAVSVIAANYFLQGHKIRDGYNVATRGVVEMLGGTESPPQMNKLSFAVPDLWGAKIKVEHLRSAQSSFRLPIYPFGADTYGDRMISQTSLTFPSTPAQPYQEIGGLVGISPTLAQKMVGQIDQISRIMEPYAQHINFRAGFEEMHRMVSPSYDPKEGN